MAKGAILMTFIFLESSKMKLWNKFKMKSHVQDVEKRKANKKKQRKLWTLRCAADVKKYITAPENAKRKITVFTRDIALALVLKKLRKLLQPQFKRLKKKRIDI